MTLPESRDYWPDLAEEACEHLKLAFAALNKAPGLSLVFAKAQREMASAYRTLKLDPSIEPESFESLLEALSQFGFEEIPSGAGD